MTDKHSSQGTCVPNDFRLQSWLLKADLSMGAKLTYSVLACCCKGRDYVWPSQVYLAKCVSVSERTIQRYLKELVNFGLIKISKKHLMGQIRSIYIFLNHALLTFEAKETSNSRSIKSSNAAKKASNSTTKTTKQGDKKNAAYIKEESFIDNNNIPPTPQNELNIQQAELLTAEASSVEGESINSGVKKEDQTWLAAKKTLAEKMSDYELQCWINPLICERGESRAVLRLPNSFFLRHVKKEYGADLLAAFKAAGISDLSFELMTPEQVAELEERAKEEDEKAAAAVKAVAISAAEAEKSANAAIGALPLEAQFDLLYSAYPVKKDRERASKIFMRLVKNGQLPPITALFQSIKEHQDKDRWWREKMPPLLSNWLADRKWQDKPYE